MWQFAPGLDTGPLVKAVRQTIKEGLWQKVGHEGHLGKGAEEGVNLTIIHKHLKKLSDRDLPAHHGALLTTVTAGMWPKQRRAALDP